jgi:hypothetical protein
MLPTTRLSRTVLHRARARRRSEGAVMFIVVVTLGLLAAMGVYGLTATQSDIKSAGHMREALQAQRAGEHALMMTAETFNPAAAKALVESMSGAKRTTNCKTAMTYAGPLMPVPPQAACLRLTEAEMKAVGASINAWTAVPGFAGDSFGAVNAAPTVEVEISNPVDIPPPAGSGYDPATQRFTQVTATVFVNVRSTIDPNTPAQSVVAGRGRLTVGPITGSAASY